MFHFEFFIKERSFVAIVGKWSGVKDLVGFINIYGPRDKQESKEVWSMVELICRKEEVKWCVFDNFNEVRREHERLNLATNTRDAKDFNEFIRISSLIEVPMEKQVFFVHY